MIFLFKIPCPFFSFSKTIPCTTFSVLSFPSRLHFRSPTPITMLHAHHRNLLISTVVAADEDWGDGHGDGGKVSRAIFYLLPNENRPSDFVVGKLKMVLKMEIKDGRKALRKARYNKSKKHQLLETDYNSAMKYQAELMEGDLLVDTEVKVIGDM